MKSYRLCILLIVYSALILVLLDSDNNGSSAEATKKPKKTTGTGNGKKKPVEKGKCPKDRVHLEEFQMKMALCRPNISVVCTAKPNGACVSKGAKIKTTAFVNKRNGQCLLESNVTASKTLRFFVEAKRVANPNADGSRSIAGQQSHQRGKCLLKYVCDQRFLRTITMECGSVIANERGELSNFTRQRSFWIAPPKFKDYVYFSAEMAVSSDKRELNIGSATINVPGMEQVVQTTTTTTTTSTTSTTTTPEPETEEPTTKNDEADEVTTKSEEEEEDT